MKMFNNEKNLCLQKHTDSNSKKWTGLCAKCSTWVDSDHTNIRSSKEGESWGHTNQGFSWVSHISSQTSRIVLPLILFIVFTIPPLLTLFFPLPSLSHFFHLVSSSIHAERPWRKHPFLDNRYPLPSVALLLLFHFTSYYGCRCLPPYLPAQP